MALSSFSRRSVAGRGIARAAATGRITCPAAHLRRAALLAAAAAAIVLAAAATGPASAHNPASFGGGLGGGPLSPPTLALDPLDAAGNLQTGAHLHYDAGADGRNRVRLTIKHWCINSGHFNQWVCPMPGLRFRDHHAPITFYVFDGASGRASSDAVTGAKGYRPASGGGWSDCASGSSDICVISASEHYRAEGTKSSWNTVSMTFEISFSVPAGTSGQIRIAAKHRHPHSSSDTWTEVGYAEAEPDLAIELTPYSSGGSLETGDVSTNARTYAAGPNKVRIRIMASATRPLRAAHFDHFTSVRIGIFAGASGRAASDAVGGAAVKKADGSVAWRGCQTAKSAQWPCTMTSALYAAAPGSGTPADAERGVDFSFTLPSGTTGAVRLFAQFTHSSRSGSGSAELSYSAPAAASEQPTAPAVQQLQPPPPKIKLVPYTQAGALETGDLSTNVRDYVAGTGRQRVRLSVVDSDGDAVAYSKIDSIKLTVFSGASGRADSQFISSSAVYAVAGGSWGACTGSGAHDACVISRAGYKIAAGASSDDADIGAIEFTFSVPAGTTGGIRLAAALAPADSGAAIQWTELAYQPQSSVSTDPPPADPPPTDPPPQDPPPRDPPRQDPQPQPITSSPTPAAALTPYTSGGALETGDVSTNTRSYAKGAAALNKVRLTIGPASGSGAITYADISKVEVHVFGTGSGRAAGDAVSGAKVRSATGAAWSTCAAVSTGHAICGISRAAWKTAAGASGDDSSIAALDFGFRVPSATSGGIRLAVALYPASGSTSWTEVAYGEPSSTPENPAPEPATPTPTPSTAPAPKLTPYTSGGTLEASGTTSRSYTKGSTRNKVRLSVGPSSGNRTIVYGDIDKAAVYLFSAGSGRAIGDALTSGSIWAFNGRSWSTCALPQTGFANCEISRAAWKTAAGASSDDVSVAALDFSFKLTTGTSGAVRLAIALYAAGSSTPIWTEVAYDDPSSPRENPAPEPATPTPTPSATPEAKLTPYTSSGTLETSDTTSRTYSKGSTLNKVRLSVGPSSGNGTISYADIDKVAVHVFGTGNGRASSDAVSGASVRSSTGAAWSTCASPSSGHAICEISRAAWKTAAGASSDDASVAALDFSFKLTAATSGNVRLAVALYASGNSTPSWTEVAYDAPQAQQPETAVLNREQSAPTPAAKLTPYTSGGTLEADGTTSRRYAAGSTLNKVRLSVGPSSGNGTISYADIDKVAVHVFGTGSGRASSDSVSGATVRSATGGAWGTCAAPSSGHAICEISRAAWKTAAGASADSATVAALDFSFKLAAATIGNVRLAVALYAGGSATPTWTEVAYDGQQPETAVLNRQQPTPTPEAKLTPYTAAGELETGDVQTNSRRYAAGSALNKVRLSVGPSSGNGTISYADIDKVAVHVFRTGSGRASSDAVSGATVRSSSGAAWSTCASPSSGHAICEISRTAWKTAAGDSADSAAVAALDFGFQLAASPSYSSVRLAVALYAAGGSTPSWTEITYTQPPVVLPPPPPPPSVTRSILVLPTITPAAKLTPYAADGTLETGDVSANRRRYSRGGTTLNKVRLGVEPQGGSGTIVYADIDKAAVHVFSGASGRNQADAFTGALVRSSTGTSWSACSAPSSGHAICEISRAAWKAAAGDSADSDAVGALDFAFRLPASASGTARLAVMLTAKNGGVISWAELRYSEPAGTGAPGGPGDGGEQDATDVPENPGSPDNPDEPGGPPDHPESPVCTENCEADGDPGTPKVASARLVRADGRAGAVPINSDVPLRLVLRGPNGEFVPAYAVSSIRLVILTGRGAATLGECPPGVACSPTDPPEPTVEQMPGGPRVAFSMSADQPVEPLSLNFRAPDRAGQTEICAVIINAAGGAPLLAEVIIDYVSTLPAVRLRLGEPGRYLHRHATPSDDSDRLIFTAAAFDRNGDRSTMPQPTSVAVTGPRGEEIGVDRIRIAEACGYAGGSACRYRLSSVATIDDPLDEGRYLLHLRAGRLSASVAFQVVGPAARIVLERAHPGAYGERFAIRARVYDRFGEPVADGTPVWISAVVRDQGLNHAVTSAGPVVPRRALTSAGSAVSSWAVLGRELAIVTALAGGERRDPNASITAVIDTGLRGDCSARSLSSHQAGAYAFWLGGPGCRVSDLGDVLLDLTGSVWLWNGKTWLRYAQDDGLAVPGSIDFNLRKGDLLWLGAAPPDGAAA